MITLFFTLFFLMVPPAIAGDGNEKDEFKQIDSSRLSPTVAAASSPISTDMPKEDAKKGEDRIVGACLVDNSVEAYSNWTGWRQAIDMFCEHESGSLKCDLKDGWTVYDYEMWACHKIKWFIRFFGKPMIYSKNSKLRDLDQYTYYYWRDRELLRFFKEKPEVNALVMDNVMDDDLELSRDEQEEQEEQFTYVKNLYNVLYSSPNNFIDIDISNYKYDNTSELSPFEAERFFSRHKHLKRLCVSSDQWKMLKEPLFIALSTSKTSRELPITTTQKHIDNKNIITYTKGMQNLTVTIKRRPLPFLPKTAYFPQQETGGSWKVKQQFIAGANWLSRLIGRR